MKEKLSEQSGWCGPACLQWIAKEFGLVYTQVELVKILGTTEKDGTSPENMIKGAREIGIKAFRLQGLPIEEMGDILRHHYVIVDWMSGPNENDDGHYSLLDKVENGKVYLRDVEMDVEDFNKRWYDIDGGIRNEKWAIVVCKRNSEATLYGKRRYDYKL